MNTPTLHLFMGAISPSELQADLTTSTQLNKEQEKQRHVLFCFVLKGGGTPILNVEYYSAEDWKQTGLPWDTENKMFKRTVSI